MHIKELPNLSITALEQQMKAPDSHSRAEALQFPPDSQADALVIFAGAEWCRPCKKTYTDLPDTLPPQSQIAYRYCDANKDEFVVGYCSIRSFPSAAIFVAGKFQRVIKLNPETLSQILSFQTSKELHEFCGNN